MAARGRKRFYKNVEVVSSGKDNYEITLDHRKLKTPSGSIFTVKSEPLALAISAEWNAQKDTILVSQMHLTGLVNTCIDNPNRFDKYSIVESILNFLDTDTLLFFADEEPAGLLEFQGENWSPVIDWFNESHQVEVIPSRSVLKLPVISPEDRNKIRRALLSRNFESVNGLMFGVEALKSIVLMMALMQNVITVDQAVSLSRLETEFQKRKWGNVEWAHDLELHDTTCRVAAASLFIQTHSNSTSSKEKLVQF